jgi:predicted DNA-binding protein (MmcQ/YjbR family)
VSSYIEWVRWFCLSLPGTTEKVQWEHNLLFSIGGKMFCIANLEPGMGPSKFAFKCTPEKFTELVEFEGVIPAPYLARNNWASLTDIKAFRQSEIEALIHKSYQLVREKLPKRIQAALREKK